MSASLNNTDSTTNNNPSTGYGEGNPTPQPDPAPADKPVEPELDEFGYAKNKPEPKPEDKPEPKPEDKPAENFPKPEDKPVEKPATGYNKPEDKPAEPKPEDKPADKPEDKPEGITKEDLTEVLGELPEFDKNRISDFALKNKMTKDQVQAYADLIKNDITEAQQNVQIQRQTWKKELIDDPEFGGENFDKNVDKVEKVLEKHLPHTKKMLTDRGGMMPPYIMRDLLGIAKFLNPTTKMPTGEPSVVVEESSDKDFLNEMYK